MLEPIKGVKFPQAVKLKDFKAEDKQGVYIIFYKKNNDLLSCYVGSSTNIAERGFPFSHHKTDSMIRKAGGKDNLYISVAYMPKAKREKVLEIERELIEIFDAPCNG